MHAVKHPSGIPFACLVAFCAGALLFPACSWGSTGNQVASIKSTIPASDLRTGIASLVSEKKDAPDTVPARQVGTAFSNSACQQDIADRAYAENVPAGSSCIAATGSRQPFSIQLGRQIGNRNDILGEFDGVRVDYHPGDALTLKGIAGYPVPESGAAFNTTRQVFGVSATTGHLAQSWDLSSYLVEQLENGQRVGKSMGGASRYLEPGRSMLVYLDYDPDSGSLGALMASGAVKLPFKTILGATFGLQSRPIPVEQEQYLAQSMTAIDGWNWIVPDDRVKYHAAGGASEVELLAVELSYALSPRIRLQGDLVRLDINNEALAATKEESGEYFYHLNVTGKGLIIPGDLNRLDLRHSVTESGRTYTASIDSKYMIRQSWNLISRLRADYNSPADDSSPGWAATPTVKMVYHPNEQTGFHIEAGGNYSNGATITAGDSRASCFVSLGYQAKF